MDVLPQQVNEILCPIEKSLESKEIRADGHHAFYCGRDGTGNLKGMRASRHFKVSLLLTKIMKQTAKAGDKKSLVVREAVVVESTDWRRKGGSSNDTSHRSDIRVTTAGVDTHYDLVITTPQPCGVAHPLCTSCPGDAAKRAFNEKMAFYRRFYDFPDRRLVPIAIEIHGRWHQDSRKALKTMLRLELSDGDKVDYKTLSFQMSHLLKATAVELARERALAILKLEKNIREFPHEQRDVPIQNHQNGEE
jgi:hypothetical protein